MMETYKTLCFHRYGSFYFAFLYEIGGQNTERIKNIKELASEIKDDRLLALFSAFVKALDSKDYKIMKKLTILRYLVGKCENIHFEFGLKLIYKLVYRILQEKDYFYWERKLLTECTDINN